MEGKKYIFVRVKETPNIPEEDTVYVIADEARIVFVCPCGCDSFIILPMFPDPKVHPNWKIVNHNTIIPSINRTVGCKSHFFITNGIVKNHPDGQ